MRCLFEKRIQDKLIGFNDLTKTLRIVDIGGPGAQKLPVSQVSLLIRYLPNLTSLGGFERTGAAVELAHQEESSMKFNLTFIHDLYTNIGRIHVLYKTCPKLKELYLDCPKGTAVQNIAILREIRHLKLHKAKSCDLELALKDMNKRLKTLNLSTIWGSLDLATLTKYCPYLTKLELHGVDIIGAAHDEGERMRIFPVLSELLIYRTILSPLMVKTFLNCSILLEHVAIGECNQINDDEMIVMCYCREFETIKRILAWSGNPPHNRNSKVCNGKLSSSN